MPTDAADDWGRFDQLRAGLWPAATWV